MKKISLVLALAMIASMLCLGASALKTTELVMSVGDNVGYVNGVANEYDVAPIVVDGRAMLPVRYVAEGLGALVEWDSASSTATITSADVEIKITIGAESAIVNGESVALDVPAFIENGRTYMPVYFIAEKLGATVLFDEITNTASMTLVALSYPDGFDYTSVDLAQYVKLGEYKEQTYEADEIPEVTDEEIALYVAEILSAFATSEEVTGRAAALGDTVVIDFVGKLDGVAFDGGTAAGQTAVLGSGQYIPGFEEGIVGMNIGETKDITVTFPAEYHATELAGKETVFTITLHKISENKLPELNDEFVKTNFGMENVAAFEVAVKAEIEAELMAEIESEMSDIVINSILDSSEIIAYPDGLISDYVYNDVIYTMQLAESNGLTYEALLASAGFTADVYETYLESEYEASVAKELVLMAIAKAENVSASEEDVDMYIQYMCMSYGVDSLEALSAQFGMSVGAIKNTIKTFISTENANDFVIANNYIKAE